MSKLLVEGPDDLEKKSSTHTRLVPKSSSVLNDVRISVAHTS